MSARIRIGSACFAAGLLASVTLLGSQDVTISADQFQQQSRAERIQTLSRLATQAASPATPAELRQLLVTALADTDPSIRIRALSVVASRAGGPRFSNDEAVLARANNELSDLRLLREPVIARLSDADAEVRDAAVLAIGNLDAADGGWAQPITLRPDTVGALLAALRVEVDPAVRASLVEALAVSTNTLPKAESWWPDLMRDSSAAVRQYAAKGVRKLPVPVALPLLVASLTDPDRGVRLTSAQMIGQFKGAASHLTPALLLASDSETDPTVKKTLQAAIDAVRAQ